MGRHHLAVPVAPRDAEGIVGSSERRRWETGSLTPMSSAISANDKVTLARAAASRAERSDPRDRRDRRSST